MLAVGANSAHVRRQVDDHVRARIIQHAQHIRLFHQVILLELRHKNLGCPVLAQALLDKLAQEPRSTGHANPPAAPKWVTIHRHAP